MITLLDMLNIKSDTITDYKIHFAIGTDNKLTPYEKFLTNDFNNWQECQTNKNFSRKYVISLIYYKKDIWMFAGVYIVKGTPKPININSWKGWKYDMELSDCQQDLIGRAFFYYKKDFRMSYPCLELCPKNCIAPNKMDVRFVLDKRATISDFEGFDKVNISYSSLKYIVNNEILSWKSALSNVKGIYLIVDIKTGKQYVGSACGEDCLWQRWKEYAKNGHGGNIELKELLLNNNDNYINNLKYSILEVCNMNLGSDYILSREVYWKNVLLTRQFGLNKN